MFDLDLAALGRSALHVLHYGACTLSSEILDTKK